MHMVALLVTLEQATYSWRHDTVLMKLVKGLKQLLPPAYNIYSDLDAVKLKTTLQQQYHMS